MEFNENVKFKHCIGFIQLDQTNIEDSREESPQSTDSTFGHGHIEEPILCKYVSKTVDTHLLQKIHCSWSFRQ